MTKIMLVEDDKSLREIYGVRLQAEGYDIRSAGDGEEALAMAIKERPDLILSDVMMPKISGFDMLDILRSTPETKDIKVIMMTALSSEDQRARGETLGANRYLVKSQVGIEDVVRTIHDLLGDAPNQSPATNSFSVPVSTPATPTPPSLVIDQPDEQVLNIPTSVPIPQPTAPFSTPMTTPPAESMPSMNTAPDITPSPAPTNLDPTISQPMTPIEPVTSPVNQMPDPNIANLINQELNNSNSQSQPQI
jgi:CheY-like chemotaxis protein